MSDAKKTTRAKTTAAKNEVAPSGQTPKERKAAEAELRLLIEKFAPTHNRLIVALRRTLRKRLPAAVEIVYEYGDFFAISYSPNEHGYEGIFGIRANEAGVKLFFNRAKELSDPEKLLKGSGKLVRAVDIDRISTISNPAVASIIDEAIRLNHLPFTAEGPGSVVIRTTTAKKRGAKGE